MKLFLLRFRLRRRRILHDAGFSLRCSLSAVDEDPTVPGDPSGLVQLGGCQGGYGICERGGHAIVVAAGYGGGARRACAR